jgi:mono/diheme cytochrome c family protein
MRGAASMPRLCAGRWPVGALLALAWSAGAAEVDVSRLPPPAAAEVAYDRDVRPIFETSCFRCHSGERPRSRFNLADRDAALKGGALGVAIVPGDSARSPLIHYVARLVEDLEMPPAGKGDPLTPEQVALLRAWIDQGAKYPESAVAGRVVRSLSATPAFAWVSVSGNAARFREHTWLPDEASGGFPRIAWQEPVGKDGRFTAESRVLFGAEDYEVKLSYDQRDAGFLRGGYAQYRRWFDDTGGYYPPFDTPAFSLGRDLHLDVGRAWFEAGLVRPDWPRLTLGYEYQFREGERSTLQWGPVLDPATFELRSLYPAAKAVDEEVHVIRFDFQHTFWGVEMQDRFRGEFTDLRSSHANVDNFTLGGALPDSVTRYREGFQYFEGANTLRLEKPVKNWLLLSAGYLYSNLDGDASFSSETFIPADPSLGPFVGDVAQEIILRRAAHVFNANSQFGPWQALTLSAGVQADWSRQEGFGHASLSGLPSQLDANLDRFALAEHFGLRFTRIPFTVLHAEARLQQEDYGQFEQQTISDDFDEARDFLRDTDASADLWDVRAGVTVSPWTKLAFDAGYRHRLNDTDYTHTRDSDLSGFPGNGYPAFIRTRDIGTDEIDARLVWRTARWLKTSLKYQHVSTRLDTRTDDVTDPFNGAVLPGGWLRSGDHRADVYSLNATLTPWRRLIWNTTFSVSDAETTTGLDTASVAPYEGQIYTLLTSLTCALDNQTDLTASYAFSKADYAQDNFADGLPLGINYDRHSLLAGVKRQFKHGLTASLQYGFFLYDEPTLGGAADYTAHGIFAWFTKRFE